MINKKYNIINQAVGRSVGDVYLTDRGSEHFMRKYQGFGISVSIIDDLVREKIKFVIITYYGKAGIKRYKVSLDKFVNSIDTHNDTRFGDDLQRFVSIKDMEEI